MKLKNVGKFNSIIDYVTFKQKQFAGDEKSFNTLFYYMFMESDNIMAEMTEGYKMKKVTYGECVNQIKVKSVCLKGMLNLKRNSIVGLYMDNSLNWLRVFWAILICGYKPLLLNLKLSEEVLEQVIKDYDVKAVISDGKEFDALTILEKDIDEKEKDLNQITAEEKFKEMTEWGEEVIFMSSGTTEKVKLCAYTAENFCYQVANSVDILKRCPEIARHYKGELKLLTLLPFYHVFGFMAVYLWFGFFSRTFVFLQDLNPKTIQRAIKRHDVTHFFAVPLVWEKVCKTAINTIKKRGDKTFNKFMKGLKLANTNGFMQKLTKKAMAEVRENLFGESIKFLISGGGFVSKFTLEFFNGIGYHMANGYGMTEVGITSVEASNKAKVRNLGAIGQPFYHTEYKIDDQGMLLIKGKHMASRILQNKEIKVTNFDEWFKTFDLAKKVDGRYFLLGRNDDLIIPKSGENVNPQTVEDGLKIPYADDLCLIGVDGEPVLIVQAANCYTEDKLKAIFDFSKSEIERLGFTGVINNIVVTNDQLLLDGEFKKNRRKILKRYESGEISLIKENTLLESVENVCGELESEIRSLFASSLCKDESEISLTARFFSDLNGSSLDYFILSDSISQKYGVDIKSVNGKSLNTVQEICDLIKNA